MRSNVIEAYKQKLKLSETQRDVLVGLLLGDGCLETQNAGGTYRLKIEYSKKSEIYCRNIYEIFNEWVLTPPRIKIKTNGEHRSENIAFSTVSHGAFRFYAQQFYRNGKKSVPGQLRKLLTPRGLAYWYMDDGSLKSKESKGVILNTQGFERADVGKLIDVLNEKFELQAWERKQKDGFQIYISGQSYEDFVGLIDEWIFPSMRYKIPRTRRT